MTETTLLNRSYYLKKLKQAAEEDERLAQKYKETVHERINGFQNTYFKNWKDSLTKHFV